MIDALQKVNRGAALIGDPGFPEARIGEIWALLMGGFKVVEGYL
jgi:hypothetical protein